MTNKDNKLPFPRKTPAFRLKILDNIILVIILGLAVHLFLPQIATLENSYKVAKNMSIWVIFLAVVSQFISYLGSGYIFKSLVRLSKHSLSIFKSTMITMASISFGMIAGGLIGTATMTYRLMKKEKISNETAILAAIIPGLFNNIVLLLVSTFGLIYLFFVHELSKFQLLSFIFTLTSIIVIIGLIVWGLTKREKFTKVVLWVNQYWNKLHHKAFNPNKTTKWLMGLFQVADVLIAGSWRDSLVGAVINTVFDILTIYLIFVASNNHIGIEILLIGYGLPLLLGRMAFIIPGGVGVVESVMVGSYTALGVSNSAAVAVVLVYRLISFWLPLILGFIMMLILQRKHKYLSSF